MSRFALAGKEVYELVLARRLLLTLILVAAVVSLVLSAMLAQPDWSPVSPLDFLVAVRHVGPLLVAVLAIVLAGDAVARERQDRTIDLLFTAPATKTRYWAALLLAHAAAFMVMAALLLLFSALAGWAFGWVALKGMALFLVAALLPLFLTLDLLVLSCSARLDSGRTSLILAVVVVLGLLFTSLTGPFGWALQDVRGWNHVSAWHPFGLSATTAETLLEQGLLAWSGILKAWLLVAAAAGLAWASIVTREAGR